MKCEEIRNDFSLYLYGELGFDAEENVESHVASCPACAVALARERSLHAALDGVQPDLPLGLLASCRRDLMASVGSGVVKKSQPGLLDSMFGWMNGAWLKPVGALALIVIGFVLGRAPQPGAVRNDILATRVKNVENDTAGRVQIVLEETRQRTVSGSLEDQAIRKLLLSAAQDPADAGLRVESVELLQKDSAAAEVRQALIVALESDDNPGVRLKALEALKPYSADPEVRRSLSRVLLSDDNAGVRTQAVDLLIRSKNKDTVGVLQELMLREQNGYIRQRTQRALREMNASVDTF